MAVAADSATTQVLVFALVLAFYSSLSPGFFLRRTTTVQAGSWELQDIRVVVEGHHLVFSIFFVVCLTSRGCTDTNHLLRQVLSWPWKLPLHNCTDHLVSLGLLGLVLANAILVSEDCPTDLGFRADLLCEHFKCGGLPG